MPSTPYISPIFKLPLLRHLLFWIGISVYYLLTIEPEHFSSFMDGVEARVILLVLQIITAYSCLYVLIPYFLVPKKYGLFGLLTLLLLMFNYALLVSYFEFYHAPKYFVSSDELTHYDSEAGFWGHIFKVRIFAGKAIKFLIPTIILLTIKYFKTQQKDLKLKEQKRLTELNTLKHQLNPHFLFNTLNNLYALTIEKSDEAPEVIAKLSEMLDYMLYGCNERYVSLQKEIELIENYLALEKIRYGSRVKIQFEAPKNSDVKIAPLLFLTFIENAFKHGVSQELNEAYIHIRIALQDHLVYFNIQNSITKNNSTSHKQQIGISNVKKQLELLYSEAYELEIKALDSCFNVTLKLPIK